MDTKSYQVKMNPDVHKRLKDRANQLGLTIGDMVQNLLATFELRLQRTRKLIVESDEIDSIHKDSTLDIKIMELIFTRDRDALTDKQFEKEIKKLVDSLTGETWQPEIKIKGTTLTK